MTETVSVFSSGADAAAISVSKSDFSLGLNGDLNVFTAGTLQYSAADWIRVDTDGFTLQAGKSQAVRVSVTVPENAHAAGTYNELVFFTINPGEPPKSSVGIVPTTRIGVVVYVTVSGTEQNSSRLADMYASGSVVHVIVDNLGNTLMRGVGTIDVRDSAGNTVKTVAVEDAPILRNGERDIAVQMPDLAKGYYVLLLLLHDSRGGLLTGQLPYEVK